MSESCGSAFKALVSFWKEDGALLEDQLSAVHVRDESLLAEQPCVSNITKTTHSDYFKTGHRDGKLHLNLLPVPYVGRLSSADIFLLMINPVVSQDDYETEQLSFYRQLWQANLDQTCETNFAFSGDQRTSWSAYYRRKFGRFAKDSVRKGRSLESIYEDLGKRLAIIELVPYYSQNATLIDQKKLSLNLSSAGQVLSAVSKLAKGPWNNSPLIIVNWKSGPSRWNLVTSERILCCNSRQGLTKEVKAALKKHLCY